MIETGAVGKNYPPSPSEVGREEIAKYAQVVGLDAPFCFGLRAAREKGFRDVVAPPVFAAVYSAPAVLAATNDPEVGMDVSHNLHAGQRLVWSEPVCAGDTISTEATATRIVEKDSKGFYIFQAVSTNQHGQVTAQGTWANVVRLVVP